MTRLTLLALVAAGGLALAVAHAAVVRSAVARPAPRAEALPAEREGEWYRRRIREAAGRG